MHQLTLLLSARRRERDAQEPANDEAPEPAEPAVTTVEKEPPVRCLNESAHKLYR